MSPENPVGAQILNWDGNPSGAADSVPLRLAGGLHALVLTNRDQRLTAAYPPNETDGFNLQQAIAAAFSTHAGFLLAWLKSPPQTNESARSAVLVAAGHMIAAYYSKPLRLLELGASAGLNLRWDRVAIKAAGRWLGPDDADLVLEPDWRGTLPKGANLAIFSRAGVDLNPLDATLAGDRLRLLSYIWPDQPDRLKRMHRAIELATVLPVKITRSDAIDWLEPRLAKPINGVVTTIFHTVAWQYFPPEVQARGKALIERAGQSATHAAPLVWLSMEADGVQDGAALTLRLWPGDRWFNLGRSDFHGRWITWNAPADLLLP